MLKEIGFNNVICPIIDIDKQENFDGGIKAIKENLRLMKQVDSMMIVYPDKLPSSVLVETGYGIALTKRIVIFVKNKNDLPYILREASVLKNVNIFVYSDINGIIEYIRANGMKLFEIEGDEQ